MKPYKEFRNRSLHEAVPGKPPTMAQRHTELLLGPINPQTQVRDSGGTVKHYRAWSAQVVKDWESGEMELSRIESVMSDLRSVGYKSKSFKKAMKAHERILRLGAGNGFHPGFPRITFNQFAAALRAARDFFKNAPDTWTVNESGEDSADDTITEAPSSGDKAAAKEAIADWKDKMETVQEKITWLQKVRLKNMENDLKKAEAKFAAGDYDWVTRNLYWIGDLT